MTRRALLARAACEPIHNPDVQKLDTMVVHLDDIGYEFKHLVEDVKPIVSLVKRVKTTVLDSGFVVAQRSNKKGAPQPKGQLGVKRDPAPEGEGHEAAVALAALQEATEKAAAVDLLAAINATALLLAADDATPARESDLARAKVEVQGGLGQLLQKWGKKQALALLPPVHGPVMGRDELDQAQKKGGRLKAKTAPQLYGWVCPGCPDEKGDENSRGRFALALREDVAERLGTLYIARRQRVTIDGHGRSWAPQPLMLMQNNERRFQINADGRLNLIRLTVRDSALSVRQSPPAPTLLTAFRLPFLQADSISFAELIWAAVWFADGRARFGCSGLGARQPRGGSLRVPLQHRPQPGPPCKTAQAQAAGNRSSKAENDVCRAAPLRWRVWRR